MGRDAVEAIGELAIARRGLVTDHNSSEVAFARAESHHGFLGERSN